MDIIKLGRSKISKENPEGSDVRYETIFEELQGEIDKLSTPDGITKFDWKVVSEKGEEILGNYSKDLLVASYYCVSLIHNEGLEGLKTGTKIYSEILSVYWESLFPVKKRVRGRVSAIEWWIEKTESYLDKASFTNIDQAVIDEILKNIQTIEDFLKDKLEEKFEFQRIKNRVSAINKVKEKEKKEKPSDDMFNISSMGEAKRGMIKVFADLKKISKYLRDENTANPQSYRFARIAAWEPVTDLPPSQDGITKIPPPPDQQIDQLQMMREREEWDKLLVYAESKIHNPAFIFYLDLNRYVAESLINSGDRYVDAHDVVAAETLYFINRNEGVENLCFTDGKPFADDDTLHWISTLSHSKKTNKKSDDVSNNSGFTKIEEELLNFKKLSRKKKSYIESVDALEKLIWGSQSAREAYYWRLGLTEIFIMRKETFLLYSQLEAIINDVKRFDLMSWDPDAAVKGLKLVYDVYRTKKTKDFSEKATEVLQMIAMVKPSEAMAL